MTAFYVVRYLVPDLWTQLSSCVPDAFCWFGSRCRQPDDTSTSDVTCVVDVQSGHEVASLNNQLYDDFKTKKFKVINIAVNQSLPIIRCVTEAVIRNPLSICS